ncbi:transposase (plasmid) [Rhodovastum atsumiense]|uniref:ISL3 family transposase n=1 Tax=Rhodovastum atsumiense TaxID=504468 RepID=A0A5M6IKW2_9PROT|nr:ISL3 family transposase [Rhodovastum atsumiense]KAA5608295.1 ISL3 family transposase [Rhodovastum atsumiense]CAH2605827.1 transposase [Rhodovastum atsumiense]
MFSLLPFLLPRLSIRQVLLTPDGITIQADVKSASAPCPDCGRRSRRRHSHYHRTLADLPLQDRVARLQVLVRRFRCDTPGCRRRIFAERLPDIAVVRARRTTRLANSQRQIGLSLGGEPGARLAVRLAMPISGDTLLRLIRTAPLASHPPPRVIGIDDWAWRRGHRYGSIICDLERRRIVDLLPDRTVETVRSWLAGRTGITVIARDRAGTYAQAATTACPHAMQVADRWHLMENASAALLDAVQRSMRQIRDALGTTSFDPALLTSAERRQHEGFLRRAAADRAIHHLAGSGVPIKEIVRRTGYSRKVVRAVVRGGRTDVFRVRASMLDAFVPRLNAEWDGGCRNGAELWRRLRATGFTGALRVVSEWATRRRRAESAPGMLPRKPPPARTLARLLSHQRDRLSMADARLVAVVEDAVPRAAGRGVIGQALPGHASHEDGGARELAHGRQRKFACGVCRGHRCRPRRGHSCDHRTMVERSNRRADQQGEAAETTDVWPRGPRSSASPAHRRMTA